jgi:hypothetical protein
MKRDSHSNVEEAVAIVLSEMSPEQENHLRTIHKDDLVDEHFGFALWVRNLLEHWAPQASEEAYPAHPDDISGEITEIIWTKLQDTK